MNSSPRRRTTGTNIPTESREDRRVTGDYGGSIHARDIDACTALRVSANGALRVEHIWGAENRLTSVGPVSQPVSGDTKVECAYDYTDRRVRKQVAPWKRQLNAPEQGGQASE